MLLFEKFPHQNILVLMICYSWSVFFGYHKITLFLFQVFKVNSHWLNSTATHQPSFHIVGFSWSTYHLRSNYDPPKVAVPGRTLFSQPDLIIYFKIFNYRRVHLILDFLVIQSDPLITQIEVTFHHLKI